MSHRQSRRQFLRGAGGFSLVLPFLPSLLPRAMAQVQSSPKVRFVAISSSLGVYPNLWFPQITATQEIAPGAYSISLNALTGNVSEVFTQDPFGALKSKMLILQGLDQLFAGDHNGGMLSGANVPGLPSLDYVMAQSKKFYPTNPIIKNLIVCPHPLGQDGNSYSKVKNLDSYSFAPSIGSAKTAFDLAFGSLTPPAPDVFQPTREDLRKVVDKVFADYKDVSTSRRISAEDKRRLEDHMTMLSEIEADLAQAPPQLSCKSPTLETTTVSSVADYDKAIKNHIDILVAALACGSTRIANLVFPRRYYDLLTPGYHPNVSHRPDNNVGFLNVYRPKAKHIAYFIRALDAVQESDGKSLLYHTVMLWNNSLANGDRHSITNMPVMLAGNGGGAIDTGRLVDYRRRPSRYVQASRAGNIGRPYNQLLGSILQIVGLKPEDFEQPGIPGFGGYTGPATVLAAQAPFLTTEVRRAILPGLKI